jgi:hypothetical protein
MESPTIWYYYDPNTKAFGYAKRTPCENEDSAFTDRCFFCDSWEPPQHKCSDVIAYHPYANIVCYCFSTERLHVASDKTRDYMMDIISSNIK